MSHPVALIRGSQTDLPSLKPLWLSVHRRHVESMPELAPYVSDTQSWAARSEMYSALLIKPDTVLLLAHLDDKLIGYGLAHVMAVEETWVADTWQTGRRIGEIESLAVIPSYRGRGIGTRLLAALETELENVGVRDLILGVLPGNSGAIRLYERGGYRPTWMYLSHFADR